MVQETANFLLSRTKYRPRVAIILGSGLGGVAGLLHNVDEFLYRSIPNFIQTTGNDVYMHRLQKKSVTLFLPLTWSKYYSIFVIFQRQI